MVPEFKIIEIFCNLDDFMQEYNQVVTYAVISTTQTKKENEKSLCPIVK